MPADRPGKPESFHFPRTALARGYVDALTGRSAFGVTAGLFLAAPRRTGKSTFLRADLTPLLEAEGARVIYVDLWSDRDADPADLILAAVGRGMTADRALARTIAARLGLESLRLGPFTFRLDGKAAADPDPAGPGATLADALPALSDSADAPVALLVDEAQHALSSEAGRDAMFALKAARDAMNRAGAAPRLLPVFTGSHRDKLMTLVDGRGQPFYGATVLDLPVLGPDYVAAYVDWLNARLPEGNRFETGDVARAFGLVGHRPELLERVLQEHALGGPGAGGLARTVTERAESLRARLWTQYDAEFGRLTELQRAVLAELAAAGPDFAPFGKAALAAIGGRLGRDDPVGTSDVQSALDALRDKGLVWREARGRYALEDQGIADWLAARA